MPRCVAVEALSLEKQRRLHAKVLLYISLTAGVLMFGIQNPPYVHG